MLPVWGVVIAGIEIVYANWCKCFWWPLVAQVFDDPKQDGCLAHDDLAQEAGAELVEALMGRGVTSRIGAAGAAVGAASHQGWERYSLGQPAALSAATF